MSVKDVVGEVILVLKKSIVSDEVEVHRVSTDPS